MSRNVCTPLSMKANKLDERSLSRAGVLSNKWIGSPLNLTTNREIIQDSSSKNISKESYQIDMKSYLGCTRKKILYNDLESQKKKFNMSPLDIR